MESTGKDTPSSGTIRGIDVRKLEASGNSKVNVGDQHRRSHQVAERDIYGNVKNLYQIHHHHYYAADGPLTPTPCGPPSVPPPSDRPRGRSEPPPSEEVVSPLESLSRESQDIVAMLTDHRDSMPRHQEAATRGRVLVPPSPTEDSLIETGRRSSKPLLDRHETTGNTGKAPNPKDYQSSPPPDPAVAKPRVKGEDSTNRAVATHGPADPWKLAANRLGWLDFPKRGGKMPDLSDAEIGMLLAALPKVQERARREWRDDEGSALHDTTRGTAPQREDPSRNELPSPHVGPRSYLAKTIFSLRGLGDLGRLMQTFGHRVHLDTRGGCPALVIHFQAWPSYCDRFEDINDFLTEGGFSHDDVVGIAGLVWHNPDAVVWCLCREHFNSGREADTLFQR